VVLFKCSVLEVRWYLKYDGGVYLVN
jgi:hypothetical protein